MAKESIKIKVNPKLIEWSIETSGWEIKSLIENLKISQSIYDRWISGEENPTLNQLEILSKKTKRPLASFLLSKAPEEKPLPEDYRLHPEQRGKFDKKTFFAIRKARKLQEITKELSRNIYEETSLKIKKITLNDSPKEIAKIIRERFKLTEEVQRKFKDSYKFFHFLREKLEEENIFAFQISMPMEDARGFALADNIPNAIAVNSKDLIEARIFTLMHEAGHVLLGKTGISVPDFNDTNKVEKWCNEFASNILLPSAMAKRIFIENDERLTEHKTLRSISRKYKVSKAMLLYNMTKLKFITFDDYNEIVERHRKWAKQQVKKAGGGGIPADVRRMSELGKKFVSLVAENAERKQITYSDALGYLSIKSKNFNKLLGRL